jgi:hypothetical protein
MLHLLLLTGVLLPSGICLPPNADFSGTWKQSNERSIPARTSFGAVKAWCSQWEEHEDGRVILSRETWTLIQNGAALERCRERNGTQDRVGKQTIIYLRDAPKP